MLDTRQGKACRLATERKILFSCNSPFVVRTLCSFASLLPNLFPPALPTPRLPFLLRQVRTFYAFEESSRLFLVMECMHSDVKELLRQKGTLPEAHAAALTADLVLALEHMHGCGVYALHE